MAETCTGRCGTVLLGGLRQMYSKERRAEIPLLEAMEAEVFVLEIDASGLKEGQPAAVTIEARPDRRFAGKIRLVDKLAKPRQDGSPVQYFAVVIELEETVRELMKPGQRVSAVLTLADEDAVVVPRQAVINRGKTKSAAVAVVPTP